MKLLILFSVLSCISFAQSKNILDDKFDKVKAKRSEGSDECKYINGLLNEDESYECCNMDGIDCEDGHITSIRLSMKNLNGTFPESIGNLTELKRLNLFDNMEITGTIPDSIGQLTKLETLNLGLNKLSGSIPTSIGNLTKLKTLTLSKNNFSGAIPESIGNLTELTSMDLSSNNFEGVIPESFGKLTMLTSLLLNQNNLNGPLDFIGNLTALTTLFLSDNDIYTAIPESIGNLKQLEHLYCTNANLIGSLPDSIRKLKKLKNLELNNNPLLSGKVPNITNDYTHCNFYDTSLCYVTSERNLHCNYPHDNANCGECAENATLVDDVCQCDSGYSGLGYINCESDNKNNGGDVSDTNLLNENENEKDKDKEKDNKDDASSSALKINSIFSYMNIFIITFIMLLLKL